MLEEKRANLFWTPCAGYCIERMLEDFVKIKWVGECMVKGQSITKFIYNRIWLLNLMKKEYTGGQELLMPSVTRYASSFSTLQSLLDHRIGLKRLFQSNKWLSSRFSKLEEGKEVERTVLNPTFWKKMLFVRKSVDPIVEVLQKITSDESLSMPFIYNDMYRAKLAIKSNHGDNVRKYAPFWSVIDNHWNSLLHHPLYLAAYFLNPSYRYRPDFVPVKQTNLLFEVFSDHLLQSCSYPNLLLYMCIIVAPRGCSWTKCMHCSTGARQWEKNFCIHAGQDSL